MRQMRRISRRPNYKIIENTDKLVCIVDLGPWDKHPTVTNSAEEVVYALGAILQGRRLEYIDSNGQRDQILVDVSGKFAGFGPACAAT